MFVKKKAAVRLHFELRKKEPGHHKIFEKSFSPAVIYVFTIPRRFADAEEESFADTYFYFLQKSLGIMGILYVMSVRGLDGQM